MALFSFFKTPKHQKFNYIPRYYNPQKEKLDEIIANARGDGQSDTELAKSRISSSFKRRGYTSSAYSKNATKKSNYLLLAIIVVLFGLTYMLLTVYLPEFMQQFEG